MWTALGATANYLLCRQLNLNEINGHDIEKMESYSRK